MARSLGVRITFSSSTRGHQVCENIWNPYKGGKLAVHPDDLKEAFKYNKYAIGIY